MPDDADAADDALDDEIRRVTSILERIAGCYQSDSDESLAIRDAALCYVLVQQHESLKKAYWKLRAVFDDAIPEELKAKLIAKGIRVSDLEAEIAAETDGVDSKE